MLLSCGAGLAGGAAADLDREGELQRLALGAQGDGAAVRRRRQRVGQQVGQGLLQALLVAHDLAQLARRSRG